MVLAVVFCVRQNHAYKWLADQIGQVEVAEDGHDALSCATRV